MLYFFVSAALLLTNCLQVAPEPGTQKYLQRGNTIHRGFDSTKYILIAQDDFNDSLLNTSVWNYRQENQVRDGSLISRSNVSIGNGVVRLAAKRSGDNFTSSMISTENSFSFKYGYFECRAKMNSYVGPTSSFWLQATTNGVTNNPAVDGVELDVFEYNLNSGGTDHLQHNLHWNGYGASHQTIGVKEYIAGISTGFHVFALEWTPKEYVIYVDGIEKARTSKALSHKSEFIILSNLVIGSYGGNPYTGTYPDYFDVDYVKVYSLIPAVNIYGDCNYGGWLSTGLKTGSYTNAQLQALVGSSVGINGISSIEVPAGLKATLYSGDNFTGTTKVVTSDIQCLTSIGMNDQVASLIISTN